MCCYLLIHGYNLFPSHDITLCDIHLNIGLGFREAVFIIANVLFFWAPILEHAGSSFPDQGSNPCPL